MLVATLTLVAGVLMNAAIAGASAPVRGNGVGPGRPTPTTHVTKPHPNKPRPIKPNETKPHETKPDETKPPEGGLDSIGAPPRANSVTAVPPSPTAAVASPLASAPATTRAAAQGFAPPVPALEPPLSVDPAPAPITDFGGIGELFLDPASVSSAMAVVIGVAGLASLGLVLLGTFGRRRAPLVSADEGQPLTFQ